MKLEAKDKLLFNMLCDIYEHLGIEDRLDPDLIREAVSSDNTWALAWKYEGIFSSSDIETPAIVQEVADILEMWEILEQSFDELSPSDRQLLVEKVEGFGEDVKFSGFCHNTEPKQCQILRMLVKQMGLWEHLRVFKILCQHLFRFPLYHRVYPRSESTTEKSFFPNWRWALSSGMMPA